MTPGDHLIRFIQNNITGIVAFAVVFIMATAWIVFEAMRSHRSRQEVFRLRRKVSLLERERETLVPDFSDPIVLSRRWIRVGAAATTTDGGCLIYLDKTSPDLRTAELTIRIDGELTHQKHGMHAGERMESDGKYGTYIFRLYATDPAQANVAIALRSRHGDAEPTA